MVDFKSDYSRFSRCFGESLVQKTVETINISPIATWWYANLHCTHCSRVSCCRDETTKRLNWFLLVLTRGKKFSASLQKLFLPVSEAFFSFLTMPDNAMFAFKASLVRFTLRQVGSFVQNYLFARNAWVYFRWGYNRKQVCFKIQNVTVGKDVTE